MAPKGQGKPPHYPPLAGNQSIQMASAVNAIRMVLNGGYPPGTAGNPRPYGMPPFAQALSDDEVAAVVTYIRTVLGQSRRPPFRARQANELRSAPLELRLPMINSSYPRSEPPNRTTTRSTPSSRAGPRGAIAVAGIATAIVVALWFAFYLFVFLPRGALMTMTRRDASITCRRACRRRASNAAGRRCRSCIVVLLVGMAAFIGIHQATMPQARVETADPTTLASVAANSSRAISAARSKPDGSVTVRAIGQQYSFTPQCIVVPADTPITFRATSADVVHGLLIEGTNINTMLVPGYVSELPTRFRQAGRPC